MGFEEQVSALFYNTFGEKPEKVVKLPESGSNRLYFRIIEKQGSVIGVYNNDRKENAAFLSFTRTFESLELPVPQIIAEDEEHHCYLLSDLGDQTLFSLLQRERGERAEFPDTILSLYQKVLMWLPIFQVRGGESVDYTKCYPRNAFDRQSMMWDLNYFKYYFLKLAHIPFDEQALEEDFQAFTDFLLQADASWFMYRDFQSRNVMVINDDPYFIDYQGGRKGPLQYDVASLLYDAKADLPPDVRDHLLKIYLDELESYLPGCRGNFLTYFPGFILIRILQALGAYGYRGYYEKKSHFLQSIPYALNNLRALRKLWLEKSYGVELPTLFGLLDVLISDSGSRTGAKRSSAEPILDPEKHLTPNPSPQGEGSIQQSASGILTVTINSFSYKKGIPADPTENGGGFVFDCRALPNPGRFEEYKSLTGKDHAVIDFLKAKPEVELFLNHTAALVNQSVTNYLDRGFQHLFVNFGCTGGQHRSVYCAEWMKKHLKKRADIVIELTHTNLP